MLIIFDLTFNLRINTVQCIVIVQKFKSDFYASEINIFIKPTEKIYCQKYKKKVLLKKILKQDKVVLILAKQSIS